MNKLFVSGKKYNELQTQYNEIKKELDELKEKEEKRKEDNYNDMMFVATAVSMFL